MGLSLVTSTDIAMDHMAEELNDWDSLIDGCTPNRWMVSFLQFLDKILPNSIHWDDILLRRFVFRKLEDSVYICKAFIKAHRAAQAKVAAFFGEDATADSPEEIQVIKESEKLVALAQAKLDEVPTELLRDVVPGQVARIILGSEADQIKKLQKEGMLTPKEASEMTEVTTHDLMAMDAERNIMANTWAKKATLKIGDAESAQTNAKTGAATPPPRLGTVTLGTSFKRNIPHITEV